MGIGGILVVLVAVAASLTLLPAMVVLLGFSFPSLTADYAGMYERVAGEEGCLLVPRVLKGILTRDELKVDAIHPNAKGYEIMTARLEEPLSGLLRKADSSR